MTDNLKDLGDETLNDILEELVEMRDFEDEKRKSYHRRDPKHREHNAAKNALQRAINTVVEHGE